MAEDSPDAITEVARRRSLFSARDKLQPVKAPPPPEKPKKRKNGILASLSAFFTVCVVTLLLIAIGVSYGKNVISSPGPLQSDRALVIEKGAGADEIADLLEREGVINRRVAFEMLAYSRVYGSVKAGEFLFRREASLGEVLDTIINGKPIEHSITIPEGLTSEQIVARLKENELLVGSLEEVPQEGSILPATYKIARGTSRDQLISRMKTEQKRVLNEIWQKRTKDLPIKSPSDLVILASVVEKETGKPDERTRVAGVFVNRLNKSMRLQSDPTIVYGLVGGKGTLGRGITRADINSQTPYNTYVINGLPPGPIANPGRAAMEAAANPSRTRDLFFVADGSGGHAFAETNEQHERNVARWRQIEAAAQQPAGTTAPAFSPLPPAIAPGTRGELPSLGLPPGASSFAAEPPLTTGTAPAERLPAATAPATAGTRAAPARRPATDATTGTRRDPLANRTYDLNSPQTVPALR